MSRIPPISSPAYQSKATVQFKSTHAFQKNLGPTFGPTAKHWWEGTTALIPGFLVHSP